MWWPLARDSNTLRLKFRHFDFQLCRDGKWPGAEKAFAALGLRTRQADVTRAVNQVRDFFELQDTTLWCTIEDGDVWWCFAEAEVINLYDGDDEAEQLNGHRQLERTPGRRKPIFLRGGGQAVAPVLDISRQAAKARSREARRKSAVADLG